MLDRFKRCFSGTVIAWMWHRFAPSLVVRKRFHGASIFMNLRDNIDDVSRTTHELENREGVVLSVAGAVSGGVWDVGANVGLFTVRATLLGRRCIAFELSPRACRLLQRTRQYNGLSFEIVDRPLDVETRSYEPPTSASTENAVIADPNGEKQTLTFREACGTYGVPALIKMDIEGGEAAFFASAEFKRWICENAVFWLVEVHTGKIGFTPEWQDVPHVTLANEGGHYLYCSNEGKLTALCRSLDLPVPS